MKLKIRNNKFNHFLISKKPKTNLVFLNNLGEVILFTHTETRIELIDFLNRQLSKICDIRIVSFFYMKSKEKNVLCFSSKVEVSSETKKTLINFIKIILKNIKGMYFDFTFLDFNRANINSRNFDMLKFKEEINNILKTKGDITLPPYTKKVRTRINTMLANYKNLKIRTKGLIGDRKIRIIYKPEK
ncbi:hypothetical protein [Spiroplasma endosymbiont of Diplazon laetatorius]|uniref:hypothetical protein n=1 Tax=Spiroplasma endosymbiont of Diplazon laetatorius TaxID=3066322 RepID=UPI0030D061CA